MIKGMAITPPVIGRVSIGRVIERNGKRLPDKDDQFTITTQVQNKDGWVSHPLDQKLRQQMEGAKLRSIPVMMLFDHPDLNLRTEYSLFERNTGRLLCSGNGEHCKRMTQDGIQTLPCLGPTYCDLGKSGHCKLYGRLYVRMDVDDSSDPFGSFVFRTTSYNSVRTIAARLRYYQAISNNQLSTLPLQLKLRSKSTTMSHRTPVFYADITLREGLTMQEALNQAQSAYQKRLEMGYNQAALDAVAQQGLNSFEIELDEDDARDVAAEFYPEQQSSALPLLGSKLSLDKKIAAKLHEVSTL